MSTLTLAPSNQYRYDTVKEYQQKIQILIDKFSAKKESLYQIVSAIDITVYIISCILAGIGIILTSVVTSQIAIGGIAVLSNVIMAITKRLSSCSQNKYQENSIKLSIVTSAYDELSGLISAAMNDQDISDSEFSAIKNSFNSAMKKLEFNIINNVERRSIRNVNISGNEKISNP